MPAPASGPIHQAGLAAVMLVFAALGLFGVIASTLVPAMQTIFSVGLSLALAVQWLPLIGGGLFAPLMATALQRFGTVRVMQGGLALSAFACLGLSGIVVRAGSGSQGFAAVLLGIAGLSAGAAALQVAINPLALALGPDRTAPARLVLAQGCNALGVLAGVHLSARLALAPSGSASDVADGVAAAYLACAGVLCAVLALTGLAFRSARVAREAPPAAVPTASVPFQTALHCHWARAGALVIALYVGAEGTAGALLVSFLHQPGVLGLPLPVAGIYLANVFWGGAALSRIGGAWLLRMVPAPRVLLGAAGLAACACALAITGHGPLAGWAALSLGLCNGVMFPLIFAITLARTQAPHAAASGLLVLAIAGGAFVSALAGWLGEQAGLAAAFIVPLAAYATIGLFALVALRQGADPAARIADGE